MKKITFLLISFFTCSVASAQFEKGDMAVNLGFGVGNYYATGSGFETKIPPIVLSGEYFIMENISVGAFLGGSKSVYEYRYPSGYGYNSKEVEYTYFNLGALGNYHFVNQEKFDVYAGARLGYVNAKVEFSGNISNSVLDGFGAKGSGLLAGAHVGGRYFFTDAFAANAEMGYGIAILQVGATLKF